MTAKGEHFDLNLNSENESQEAYTSPPPNGLIIGDIKERETPSTAKPPLPPTFKDQANGFPAHRNRAKWSNGQQRQKDTTSSTKTGLSQATARSVKQVTTTQNGASDITSKDTFDSSIDKENKERIAEMSEEEISAARQELMSGLSPSLIERLLKKANIEEDETPLKEDDHLTTSQEDPPPQLPPPPKASSKKVTFDQQLPDPSLTTKATPSFPPHNPTDNSPDAPPLTPPPDLIPATSPSPLPPLNPSKIHFPPIPGPAPTLDPSSPTFLSSLKETYFPSLPHDPSTLSWMQPLPETSSQSTSTYTPDTSNTLPPSTLRFDFRGRLLPPRLSSQLPTNLGLHHHGHAPESAGYTIPELSRLARSMVPSQRCVSMQTLGRVLYRLGRGDFGPEGHELCEGLWECVERERVLGMLVEAAAAEPGAVEGEGEGKGGNRSVWVTATEACWLWRKGGGRRWKGR